MLMYTGFALVPGGREYSFSLARHELPVRLFTVMVKDNAFGPGLLRFQDAPGLCYERLLSALAGEETETPVSSHQLVTASDIGEYQAHGREKSRKWTDEQRLKAKLRQKENRARSASR